jgi:ferredoxin
MRVRIDYDLCTGDGICEEICPEVFEVREDGLAYVKDEVVDADLEEAVREAAEQCPSEAIFIEE